MIYIVNVDIISTELAVYRVWFLTQGEEMIQVVLGKMLKGDFH